MPDISVVIIHWNTPDVLVRQLQTLTPDSHIEYIVVDNDSTTESKKKISKAVGRPDITYIQNSKNTGYAAAANLGVHASHGRWLLFLNPDMMITPTQIQTMQTDTMHAALHASAARTTSDYAKPVPTFWSLLIEFTPLNRIFSLTHLEPKTLTGGCLMIRTDVLTQVGGWDERFFLWFEDSDLTRRLLNSRHPVGWIDINVQHIGGESFKILPTDHKHQIFFTSMVKYADKHMGLPSRILARLVKRRFT